VSALATFNDEALALVRSEVDGLRAELTFAQALALPEAAGRNIVVVGKEVQLIIFRQTEPPFLKGDVLITVQVARFSLGGMVSYHTERGLVFSLNAAPREATQVELQKSGG
jgi:hypothetical protein